MKNVKTTLEVPEGAHIDIYKRDDSGFDFFIMEGEQLKDVVLHAERLSGSWRYQNVFGGGFYTQEEPSIEEYTSEAMKNNKKIGHIDEDGLHNYYKDYERDLYVMLASSYDISEVTNDELLWCIDLYGELVVQSIAKLCRRAEMHWEFLRFESRVDAVVREIWAKLDVDPENFN